MCAMKGLNNQQANIVTVLPYRGSARDSSMGSAQSVLNQTEDLPTLGLCPPVQKIFPGSVPQCFSVCEPPRVRSWGGPSAGSGETIVYRGLTLYTL